jgi:hypothetical protein
MFLSWLEVQSTADAFQALQGSERPLMDPEDPRIGGGSPESLHNLFQRPARLPARLPASSSTTQIQLTPRNLFLQFGLNGFLGETAVVFKSLEEAFLRHRKGKNDQIRNLSVILDGRFFSASYAGHIEGHQYLHFEPSR